MTSEDVVPSNAEPALGHAALAFAAGSRAARRRHSDPAFVSPHRLNGNGEMTDLEWIRETGVLTTPVAITNTYGVGAVRDTLIASELKARADEDIYWSDGGGRDLRRYPKRHKRRARYRRKRPPGTGRRERRSGRRRLRRRGDGHDLPRVPRRYRHRFAVQPVI
jgi:hypothetical protein